MSKDLFDDSTMTFGEHLEVLRVHLWKAIIGLVIGIVIAFFISDSVIRWIQLPIKKALEDSFNPQQIQDINPVKQDFWERAKGWFSKKTDSSGTATGTPGTAALPAKDPDLSGMTLVFDVRELAAKLKEIDLQPPPADKAAGADPKPVLMSVTLHQSAVDRLKAIVNEQQLMPRTDGADEAFMLYLKVSMIMGLLISSPWVFYQLWLFVAAGLFPHERKYVYTYLPMSIFLFAGGALFCFFFVIPYVLNYLFWFNKWLELRPEMKIGTWISFAFTVSLMFGVSFQLPLVMLFLERISIFASQDYRDKRRISILVIAILSMVLTPSDPVSMIMMMVPLCLLYEVGIFLCGKHAQKSPFETQPA